MTSVNTDHCHLLVADARLFRSVPQASDGNSAMPKTKPNPIMPAIGDHRSPCDVRNRSTASSKCRNGPTQVLLAEPGIGGQPVFVGA